MTHSLRILGMAAALAAPSVLAAQAAVDKPVSFGVSGGVSMPTGVLDDEAESGFAVAGHVSYQPAGVTALRFRGDVSYDRWGIERRLTGGAVTANLRALGIMANAMFDVASSSSSTVTPYLLGGVGLVSAEVTPRTGSARRSESDTNLGIQLGGGLTFQLSGFSTFFEAKYVSALTEGDNATWIPITFGVRF
jgi:opacity protein-like surface antigen